MDRASVRRRDRLILEARDEIRKLDRQPTAKDIDAKVALKDPALYVKWKAAQDAAHRRKTILQVLRNENRSRAPRAPAPKAPVVAPSPLPLPAPPFVWPFGMRQRKEAQPDFKLPLLYGYPAGSERVFLQNLGERTLHQVSAKMAGRPVGYWPAIRPGTFVELNWNEDANLSASITYNGWRGHILAYEGFARMAEDPREPSPTSEALQPFRELAKAEAERVRPVMPPDLEAWKRKRWAYALEVDYIVADKGQQGRLAGALVMTMEDLWIEFKDQSHHSTPIR